MLDFSRFSFLTFDCYGTLIDWESGIFSALRPILSAHRKSLDDARLLEVYGELEAQAEKGSFRSYREVLQCVVRGFGQKLGFTPTRAEERSLPGSLQHWKPWPDTVAALQQLKARYRLAIVSNVDDDLFTPTARQLQVQFDQVITAQQAQCYKPSLGVFQLALKRIGASPEQLLHVGQSIYHDVLPAQSMGMSTVWVNRPSPRVGIGAVKRASGLPDLEVPNLAALATAVGAGPRGRAPSRS
ncbi:MAG: haloacid dehalogenase type II [Acidobacteria bacterium]|nr:MAG: haloacid dehalogenase type II [Acidobacteriota bacterium]PYY09436.1 MAG: haloacid dehalogenase type II [Acidobacteriota bacterium]